MNDSKKALQKLDRKALAAVTGGDYTVPVDPVDPGYKPQPVNGDDPIIVNG